MRKVIYFTTISLDGYFSGPNGELDDFAPDDEEHQYANDLIGGADAMLFGRGTYEVMTYWDTVNPDDASSPPIEREFAAIYQSKPRHVFSTSLSSVDPKATLHREDIVGVVSALRQQDGAYLGLGCGPALLALLIQYGLVDEIQLRVMPRLLGDGVPLFRDVLDKKILSLDSSRAFTSGSVLLTYSLSQG